MYLYDVEIKKESKFVVCIQAESVGQAINGLKRMLETGDIYFSLEDDQEIKFAVRNSREVPTAHWLKQYAGEADEGGNNHENHVG